MNPDINGELWKHFITPFDYLLLPFYLLVIFTIAIRFCNKHYPKTLTRQHPWRNYFIWGFSLKVIGSIFIGLVYEYYYTGGDTSAYFYHASVINQSFGDSPFKWINLIFRIPDVYDIDYYQYINQMLWYNNQSAYLISTITAFFSLLTFNTYLPTSIIFAALSFTGVWAMFRTFVEQYPQLTKPLAICILFIPSTIVWGSGIFKDTICIAALGWMTYAFFRMLIRQQFQMKYLMIIIFCFYLLAVIKIYIILVFLPALAMWVLNTYSHKISNYFLRTALKYMVYSAIIGGFIMVSTTFSKELGQYSLDNLAQTSNTTRTYIAWASLRTTPGGDEGSSYDLGSFDPSIGGMLTKLPLAINVSLFRPYIWEAKKPMVFLNSIEALLFLFLTLKVIYAVGLQKAWASIQKNPNIQFFLIFTLIFAFAVGISSYNFGALSRYRIPCLPFYAMALMLIYYENKPLKHRFFSLNFR